MRWLGAFAIMWAMLASGELRGGETAAAVDLDNLVPYTDPRAGWSDRHSNIVLSWPRPDARGLQRLDSLVGWGGTQITGDLLSWSLRGNGAELPLTLKSRTFRPDRVTESDGAAGIELTAAVAFPVRNALAIEFTIANRRPQPCRLELRFDYPGKGRPPDWKGKFPIGAIVSVNNEAEGSWSTLYKHHEHGNNVLWVQGFVAGMTEGSPLEMTCLADLSPRRIDLPPGKEHRLVVPMAFGRYRGMARDALDEVQRKIAAGWTPAEESQRWQAVLRKAPPLAAKYRGKTQYEKMYVHAIASLESLCIRGEGGYTGFHRIPYTTKHGLAAAFFWDTSFTCTGLREFDPVLAQEAILSFAENVGPRGSLPGTLCDSHRAGEGQAPIMGWAAWLTFERGRDLAWLRRVYPALAGNHRFWVKYHASPRGLCQFFNAGQIADNDARFDAIQGKSANQPLTGLESPDVNAFLVMDGRCLGHMAEALGKPDEARQWRDEADALARRIVDTTYFADESMFLDVRAGTRQKFSGTKTPNMFLPLWAGVPLDRAEIDAVVKRHMLNPREFYGERPFPSLSFDDPRYFPSGYWRGRLWPHVVYWMIQTLWRQGYHREAEETADRLLKLLGEGPWLDENYVSRAGGGPRANPDYNWSCATAIELLLERYKDPPP